VTVMVGAVADSATAVTVSPETRTSVSAVVPMSTTAPGRSQSRTIDEYPYAVPSDALAVSEYVADEPAVAHAATLPSPFVTSCRVPWLRTDAIAPWISMFLPEITDWRFDALWLSVEISSEIGK
jgi:hypothetical protein